jgi:hypothetical protein
VVGSQITRSICHHGNSLKRCGGTGVRYRAGRRINQKWFKTKGEADTKAKAAVFRVLVANPPFVV